MSAIIVYIASIAAYVINAIMVQKTQACLYYGRALASESFLEHNKNGFQDALTDPAGNKWFFLCWAVIIGLFVAVGIYLGWQHIVFLLVIGFLVTMLVMKFLPPPSDRRYLMEIYGSLSRREADYLRHNDKARADACRSLRELIEDKFLRTGEHEVI